MVVGCTGAATGLYFPIFPAMDGSDDFQHMTKLHKLSGLGSIITDFICPFLHA